MVSESFPSVLRDSCGLEVQCRGHELLQPRIQMQYVEATDEDSMASFGKALKLHNRDLTHQQYTGEYHINTSTRLLIAHCKIIDKTALVYMYVWSKVVMQVL